MYIIYDNSAVHILAVPVVDLWRNSTEPARDELWLEWVTAGH